MTSAASAIHREQTYRFLQLQSFERELKRQYYLENKKTPNFLGFKLQYKYINCSNVFDGTVFTSEESNYENIMAVSSLPAQYKDS